MTEGTLVVTAPVGTGDAGASGTYGAYNPGGATGLILPRLRQC